MESHGVEFKPRAVALPFGDYMADGSNVAVDTKKNVQELAMDVGRDHKRFVRECERARDAGYRLVILVEKHPEYNERDQLYKWVSYACRRCRKCRPLTSKGCARFRNKPMQGPTVAKIITRLEEKYGVRFEFCRKRDTARRICELLGVDYERRE